MIACIVGAIVTALIIVAAVVLWAACRIAGMVDDRIDAN